MHCGDLIMKQTYRLCADAGITTLQEWYDPQSGQWRSTGWWNAANVLWVILEYMERSGNRNYDAVVSNTFARNKNGSFLNNFYDDEGWWALTWMKAYDVTGNAAYLKRAETIFADMLTGWDEIFGGGSWWTKERTYKNAITNELFLTVAARLAQRVTDKRRSSIYRDWAERELDWFMHSGMLNAQNLVNDGLNDQGSNNSGITWTYNQGVILGGLVEVCRLTGNEAYLDQAEAIASAAITTLVDAQGILREPCEEGDCGADGPQFKGIFTRNLMYLYETTSNDDYKQFLLHNANAIMQYSATPAYQFGLRWSGPVDTVDAARQSSALDTLNAAITLTDSGLIL